MSDGLRRTSSQNEHAANTISGWTRFYASIQDTSWYQEFLKAVVDELKGLPPETRILDVGTGPGKLIELLCKEKPFDCVGIDSDQSMLTQARQRSQLANVPLISTEVGQSLPFASNSFDIVCFCSVLFLLEEKAVRDLLNEAVRLLRPQGRIVVLHPSGSSKISPSHFSRHWTFHLWRTMTSASGRHWSALQILQAFANQHAMPYIRQEVFAGMATLEVVYINS